MSQRGTEETLRERLERLGALTDCQRVIDALRVATSALAYVAEAKTLAAAKTTARDALLIIEKDLDR